MNVIYWEDSSWEHLSLIDDEESHQSLAREGSRIFRFCVMTWKGESEPTIKFCLRRKVDLVQEFTTKQNFGRKWRWANKIRVEYFRRIHHIAAQPQSPRVIVKIERNTREFTGRIIFMCMFNDTPWGSQDNEQECESNATSFLITREDFHQEYGHSSGLDQKRSGIRLMVADHKENGTESQNWWW